MPRVTTIHRILLLAFIAFASGFAPPVHAIERGAWFWYQSSDPNGADNVVGNNTKENEAITFFKQWHITRLYGSYSNMPSSSASTMAAWNKKLAQAGIQSFVVLSESDDILPGQQSALQSLVQSRLITFNNGRSDPLENFKGIEMDLEPHTLPEWDTGTNADRRTLLINLRDAFTTVRQKMVTGGYGSSLLSAAIPPWFDSSSSIGWTSNADRDQWFTDINTSLDTISLMAYETSDMNAVMSSTSYERTAFGANALLALRSKLGTEWTTYNDFASGMVNLESQNGAGIDIESYYRLRQIAPAPSTAGDYNNNGIVDIGDYILWRKGGPLLNDPFPGVTAEDFSTWRSHFGVTTAGAGASFAFVPEPPTWMLVTVGGCVMVQRRYRDAAHPHPRSRYSIRKD
jgi:hypothetical protein